MPDGRSPEPSGPRSLTNWRQRPKRRLDLGIHVLEMAGDLIGDCRGLIRSGQSGGFRCLNGSTECVRSLVSDTGILSSSPSGCHGRGRAHRLRDPARPAMKRLRI